MSEIWEGLPVVIFGTGATSQEAKNIIERINKNNHAPVYAFKGFVSEDDNDTDLNCPECKFVNYAANFDVLGAVLPFGENNIRKKIYEKFKNLKNIVWPNIIDPEVKIINPESIKMGMGNVIECGATININSVLGDFNLININSIIGHDNIIGNFCTINPGAVLSGNVKVNDFALIGAGGIVKQNVVIGERAILGPGAFTVKDIEAGRTLVCRPGERG